MIVFTDLPIKNFVDYNQYYPVPWDEIRVMNINSYDATFPVLYGITPQYGVISDYALLNDSESIFEQEYFQFLLNGPGLLPFMTIVMNEFREGNILWIYQIERTPYKESIIESIMSLLYRRYGIVSNIISDIEDIQTMNCDNSFSVLGLNAMDEDIMKLISMGVIKDDTRHDD